MLTVLLKYLPEVDCRIGSLEMRSRTSRQPQGVDCRIGSLESRMSQSAMGGAVDCRIGSLERILNKRDLRLYC